ncbi:YhdP family phospholipid transporter [Larsenimonas suaedae]|uniref:AsmA-like C-terminal region-containing protein n=1 Tax=Larsenimonas suaedae TaxID=1851019 RepID=A0ABU1GUI8_9GAMM|nr:AsmA-like C-terminal region-containing protein [Larsenimonas suaedae]MCM2970994.1 hypothetical protein [Larsenimonas suaedae]MDR5895703.1 AsmA-like C-terminal region-containing protein [Larsenimonas suaedae]
MGAIQTLVRILGGLTAAVLVICAIGISALRLGVLGLPVIQPMVLKTLGVPDDTYLSAKDISFRFVGFDPRLVFDDLTLAQPATKTHPARPLLTIDSFTARIDSMASLQEGAPVLGRLDIASPSVHFYQDSQGRWPWQRSSATSSTSGFSIERLNAWATLLSRQRFNIDNAHVHFHAPTATTELTLPTVALHRAGNDYQLEALGHVGDATSDGVRLVARLPDTGRQLDGKLQLTVQAEQALPLLNTLFPASPVTPTDGRGNMTLWAQWAKGELVGVQGVLDVPRLSLDNDQGVFDVNALEAKWAFTREASHWQGALFDLSGHLAGKEAAVLPSRVALSASEGFDDLTLRLPGFALDGLNTLWPILPEGTLRQALTTMAPRGQVTGLELHYDKTWHIKAGARDVHLDPWQGGPGGGPLDLWVAGRLDAGTVEFAMDKGRMMLPSVFEQAMTLNEVRGAIDWTNADHRWRFQSTRFKARRQGADVTGTLTATVPERGPQTLALSLDARDIVAKTPAQWLPLNALDPGVSTWFRENLKYGEIPRAALSMALTFNDDKKDRDQIHLDMDIRNARFAYVKGWPALTEVDGHVVLDNDQFDATIAHANQNGLETTSGEAHYRDNVLTASARVSGNASNALSFLQQAPLEASLSQSLAQWRTSGPIQGDITVRVPMSEEGTADIQVKGAIARGRSLFLPADITTTDIAGSFKYHHHDDVDELLGTFTGQVFEDQVKVKVDLAHNLVTFDGRAHANGVAGWLGLDGLTKSIDGAFNYRAALHLKDSGPVLTLSSPMTGLVVDLPPPFAKLVDRPAPLDMQMDFGNGSGELTFEDRVHARWRHSDAQGQVWLEHWPSDPEWPSSDHWYVNWDADALSPGAWVEPLSQISLTPRAAASSEAGDDAFGSSVRPFNELLGAVRLNAGCLEIKGECRGPLALMAVPDGATWVTKLRSELATGTVRWSPSGYPTPVDARLDVLNVDRVLDIGTDAADNDFAPHLPQRVYSLLDPDGSADTGSTTEALPYSKAMAGVPAGQLFVDTLIYNGHKAGPLTTRWQSDASELRLDPLEVVLPGSTFNGALTWADVGERSLTRMEGRITSKDLADTVTLFTEKPALHTDSATFNARVAWPGAPWQVELGQMGGHLRLDTGPGRLTAVNSTFAKVLGAVNLDNLMRRLALNFSDLTQKGVAFKRIHGAASLLNGRLVTDSPVVIDGTATSFTVDGQLSFIQQTIDARLGVTVPVTQNLPLAAFAIGAPQVGGVLWLFHELFEGWLNDVSQIHYRVRGPFGAPHLSLESAE